MVRVHARLRCRIERILECAEALGNIPHIQGATGIHYIDALCPVAFHELPLLGKALRRRHVAHHQEAHRVHPKRPRVLDMLSRDIRFGAVGCHSHHARPRVIRFAQVMQCADAGDEQCRHLRTLHSACHRGDPLVVGMRPEAIVEAGSSEAVTVCYFDAVHPCIVQGLCDCHCICQRVLMTYCVHAVPERDVRDIDFSDIAGHHFLLQAANRFAAI